MISRERHLIANAIAATLCVMLVLFPKGGIRIGTLPATWGYGLLFLLFPLLLPYRLLGTKAIYLPRQLIALLCAVPMTMVLIYSVGTFGMVDLGGFVSDATNLIFMPLFFLWLVPPMLPLINWPVLIKCLRFCILSAAIFGIVLFFWRPLTGSWIQIPYLTVNGGDLGDFAFTKNINRGFFLKLISTYNNGNIYGAATLILLRLFELFTPSRWQRWTLRCALALTLSRTIWAGLIFDQLLTLAGALLQQRHTFPRVRIGKAATVTLILAAFIPVAVVLLKVLDVRGGDDFLLDPTLGGRTEQFRGIGQATFFPYFPPYFSIAEVTYLAVINAFGFVGSLAISCILLSPLLIVLMDRRALHDPVRKAALKGLLTYALISTSDGAISLIPVMAFYWFTYMIFLFGMPGVEIPSRPTSKEPSRVLASQPAAFLTPA